MGSRSWRESCRRLSSGQLMCTRHMAKSEVRLPTPVETILQAIQFMFPARRNPVSRVTKPTETRSVWAYGQEQAPCPPPRKQQVHLRRNWGWQPDKCQIQNKYAEIHVNINTSHECSTYLDVQCVCLFMDFFPY